MANTKISQLTANTSPTGAEELVYAYNNSNGKMTLNTMKTFTNFGLQPELQSGVNIKTINGNNILGSGNIDIQGGGGGGGSGSMSLYASENIDAGSIVSFDGTGVKKLRRGFYGTASTGISLTVNTQQYNIIDSVAVNDDTVVVVYMNGTQNVYAVAIQYDGESRTVGTPVKVNTSDSNRCNICSPYTGEFVITYRNNSSYGCAIAGSVSGTTITLGTETSISGTKVVKTVSVTRRLDTDDRSFVAVYLDNTDNYLYYNSCTYDGSLAITPGTAAVLRGGVSTTARMGISYLGNGYAGVVFEYQNSTYFTEFIYVNVGGSISASNRVTLYNSTSASIGWSPKSCKIKEGLVLVDAGGSTSDNSASGLYLVRVKPSVLIIQHINPWFTFPIAGRSYCNEDYGNGIVGMFANGYASDGTTELSYTRYKGTETGLEFIDKVVYGSTSSNTIPTVARLGNMSICSYVDGTNSVLGNLIFQDESDKYVGAISSAATEGDAVTVTYSGVVNTTGLTAGLPVYIGLDGAFSQVNGKKIGIATGSTDALLM